MKKILIVDDEFGIAEALCALLTRLGYVVTTASNGELALAKIAEQRPDLILSDVMMPIMDGPELLRTLKASPCFRDIPVVLMSALQKLDKEEFPDAAGFLTKPFVFDALVQLVQSIIGTPA